MDDFELLQAYASRRDEAAFAALTSRYLNLVYSSALRQTSDAQSAEDVTQAVFLTLARKAGSISRTSILPGWLLRTTRFAAANARRLQQRRQHYEKEAMQEFVSNTQSEQSWEHIAPRIDEALDQLGETDRNAIVLRFFQHHSLKLLAQKLGTTEDTAQKRVSRALEKLRVFFARHGNSVSAAGLASALAANSVHAAPATLAPSIASGLAANTASKLAVNLAEATAEAIGRARFQMLAMRWGGFTAALAFALVLCLPRLTRPPVEEPREFRASISSTNAPQATPSAATFSSSSQERRPLLLRVIDARTAIPVGNVLLSLVSTGDAPGRTTNTFATDAQGISTVFYSTNVKKSWSHRIELFRDGYVPRFLSWSDYQQDRIEEIPAEYTVRLDPAVTIGGMVLDEQEAPVPDMQIVFTVSGPIPSRSRERLTMMGNYHTEITDAGGRWSCNHVPARFGMIAYRLVHPLFQEKLYACDSPDELGYVGIEKISEEEFLAQRAVMRAQSGIIIAGTVTDENKQPIPGAKVSQGHDFRAPQRNMVTEADGTFRFTNGRPGDIALTFQASGFAPVVRSLTLSTNLENLQILLPIGRALLGRVTDESGVPIHGATIEAASPTADSRTLFEWHTKSDDDGRFSWDAAPASQDYAVYAPGYQSLSRVTLAADGTEHDVKLSREGTPSVRILGQILDAETRLAPPSPKIQIWETSREPNGGFSNFTTTAENLPADGRFRLSTSAGTISYILEAQGDGYSPKRITNEVTGTAEVHITIELVKASPAAGVVLTPSGEPAAGATIAVCGPDQWVQMNKAAKLEIGSHSQASGTIADAQGHFKLPAKYAADRVVVAHPSGFAELPFSAVGSNTAIILQPYGRIQGSVHIGGKASCEETVRLSNIPWSPSRVSIHLAARTDVDGAFHFDSVPGGEWLVQRELNNRPEGELGIHFPAYSHGLQIVVRSGETSQVALGGTGHAVIGRAIAPDPGVPISWTENMVSLILKVPGPEAPKPPMRGEFPSDQAFQVAQQSFSERSRAYWTSPQGRELQRLQRAYRAMFDSDGSFRLADVPPGDYSLKIELVNLPRKPGPDFYNVSSLASLELDVTIPSTETNGIPVDLGDLQLTKHPNP